MYHQQWFGLVISRNRSGWSVCVLGILILRLRSGCRAYQISVSHAAIPEFSAKRVQVLEFSKHIHPFSKILNTTHKLWSSRGFRHSIRPFRWWLLLGGRDCSSQGPARCNFTLCRRRIVGFQRPSPSHHHTWVVSTILKWIPDPNGRSIFGFTTLIIPQKIAHLWPIYLNNGWWTSGFRGTLTSDTAAYVSHQHGPYGPCDEHPFASMLFTSVPLKVLTLHMTYTYRLTLRFLDWHAYQV